MKNKIDLNESIDDVLVETLMNSLSEVVQYFEISCMTGDGFDDLSNWLVMNCFECKNSVR